MPTVTRVFEFDAASEVRYKPIPGFTGYRVGDDGSVWSCRRNWSQGKWRRLSATEDGFGYLRVGLQTASGQEQYYIHRLVLLAFVGPCPKGMESRHFPDRDPSNNRLDNLSWAFPADNAKDKVIHGTAVECIKKGERNGFSKLTAGMVRNIRQWREDGDTLKGIADRVEKKWGVRVTLHAIYMVVKRKNWKHI